MKDDVANQMAHSIDGLIFQPVDDVSGVIMSVQIQYLMLHGKIKIGTAHKLQTEFLCCYCGTKKIYEFSVQGYEAGPSNELVLKWKPHNLNSIDFKLQITEEQDG